MFDKKAGAIKYIKRTIPYPENEDLKRPKLPTVEPSTERGLERRRGFLGDLKDREC
jgi:hypothetical protein